MAAPAPLTCRLASCKAQVDGKCVEGFADYTTCHNFGNNKAAPEALAATKKTGPAPITVYAGNALTPDDAYAITAQHPVKLIVLGGEVKSGKTTLTAGLYECLQKRSPTSFAFAGSRTLRAFEERCHLSRQVSGRTEPGMERTPFTEVPMLLHLALRHPDRAIQHVLITDTTGELFEKARNSEVEAKRLVILRRADVFGFLVDGELLARRESRHKVAEQARTLARRFVEAGMIRSDLFVDIIITKGDKVAESTDEKLPAYIESLLGSLKATFEKSTKLARTRILSARPAITTETFDALLNDWLEDRPRPRSTIDTPSMGHREMDRVAAAPDDMRGLP